MLQVEGIARLGSIDGDGYDVPGLLVVNGHGRVLLTARFWNQEGGEEDEVRKGVRGLRGWGLGVERHELMTDLLLTLTA
jgi:hypothetical protein